MKTHYIDFIDLEGTFEEVLSASRVLGSASDERNETAVKGFLGLGYLVREDGFRKDGSEVHRVYFDNKDMLDKLPKTIKYLFRVGSGFSKKRPHQVTIKTTSYQDALFKAQKEMEYRFAQKGKEVPITWEFDLISREYA